MTRQRTKVPASEFLKKIDTEAHGADHEHLVWVRGSILSGSADVESLIAEGIIRLLGIRPQERKTFIEDLSFDNHIKLLKDMQPEGVDLSLLNEFKKLRNEFAHGTEFKTYTSYYTKYSTQGVAAKERLLKYEAEQNLDFVGTLEQRYAISFAVLLAEVLSSCAAVFNLHDEKTKNELANNTAFRIHKRVSTDANIPFIEELERLKQSKQEVYTRDEVRDLILRTNERLRAVCQQIQKEETKNAADEFNRDQLKNPADRRIAIEVDDAVFAESGPEKAG